MLLALNQETDLSFVFNILILSLIGFFVLKYIIRYAEQSYAEVKKKPFVLNFVVFKKDLSNKEETILNNQFSFYKRLSNKEQLIFKHRLSVFINSKEFVGRENLEVTSEMRVLISATAVMITFGFRNYNLPIINTILVYPKSFYSNQNQQLHKGEVNPRLSVIALSWEDFRHGFDIENDNLNLGIHEFAHAIHLNSYRNNDVSSLIFRDGFNELKSFLKSNELKRQQLITTKYFREYAYTNEFEFAAVLIECFIETPDEFKSNFPTLYNYVKQMLNFNFASF